MANAFSRQQLALLYQLQARDQELLAAHKQLQAIPRQKEQLQAGITKSKAALTAKTAELAEAEKAQRARNAELEMNAVQRDKYRAEQREVTSNEAYSALERQIEFLDQKDEEAEDAILELMEDSDRLKVELTELEAEVAREDEKTAEKTAQLQREQKTLETQMNEKLAERKAFLPKIDKRLSEHYRRWFERQKTGFVALGENGTCTSCRIAIQPQTLKEAQKYEKPVYCSSCKRLLYVQPPSPDIPFP